MKKIFMVLCVVILFFGLMGCPSDSPNNNPGNNSPAVVSGGNGPNSPEGPSPASPVPEPATLLLLGSGLVGLAGVGRKKFFKKDRDE